MTMFHLALLALSVSGVTILTLCLGDPKRRRTTREGGGMAPRQRQLLAAMACLPGFACVLLGDPAAFLMWLGGCALIGWALASGFRDSGGSSIR